MGQNARGAYQPSNDIEESDYVTGNWYNCGIASLGVGIVIPAASIRLVPFRLRARANLSQLGARITTLAAGGLLQLGVYAAQQDTLLPIGQPIAKTASIATDAAGNVAAAIIGGPVQAPRGIYWFGINVDATAGGVVIMQTTGVAVSETGNLVGGSQASISSAAAIAAWCRTFAAAFGTWPDLSGQATAELAAASSAAGQFLIA